MTIALHINNGGRGTVPTLQQGIMDLLEKFPSGKAFDGAGRPVTAKTNSSDYVVENGLAAVVYENQADVASDKRAATLRIEP